MEYKDFVYKVDAYNGFVELRKVLNELLENSEDRSKFEDAWAEVGALAMSGNPIAQDIVAYYYKDGINGFLPENYDLYMKWSILAAANGNEFAIEKLQFFLNYAFQELITEENLQKILSRNEIDENNYFYVIGNLLCEGLVDEMHINAKDLVEEKSGIVKYTPERLRVYKRELEKALPRILDYLLA